MKQQIVKVESIFNARLPENTIELTPIIAKQLNITDDMVPMNIRVTKYPWESTDDTTICKLTSIKECNVQGNYPVNLRTLIDHSYDSLLLYEIYAED